ncbi:MAG TPA: acyltransferase [Marmoricola sp.]|jgi:peptidoglycan/LPS O-acetylase OafA/YrhL|nr:acyltransferase [Marmoricola sp.]
MTTTGLTHDGHKAASSRAEILPLTGLRAVAATAVVIHHIQMPASSPEWVRTLGQAGFIGVPLFFMLSGFVLAYNYPTLTLRDPRSVCRFWVARVARVMPLYWAVLIILVLTRATEGVPQDRSLPLHFLALQTWSGSLNVGATMYNAPGWSICVEMFLYAIFPFLVLAVAHVAKHYGAKGLLALAVVAFAIQFTLWLIFVLKGWADLPATNPQSAHRWLYRNPLTRTPEFTIGMCMAFIVNRGFRFPPWLAWATQTVLVIAIPLVCALRDPNNGPLGAAFFGTLWTIPFALLIVSLASDTGFFARFLATRFMVTLGTASFALYLTHRGRLPGFGQSVVQTAPGHWGYVAVLIIIVWVLLLAEGAHRYIEVPCRTIILNFYDRLVPRVKQGSAS